MVPKGSTSGEYLVSKLNGNWSISSAGSVNLLLDLLFPIENSKIHAQMLLTGAAAPTGWRPAQRVAVVYVEGASPSEATIDREAGTLFLKAYPRSPAVGLSGSAAFAAKSTYQNELKASGFSVVPSQQLSLAIWDVGLGDFQVLKVAFPTVDTQTVLAVRMLGYTAQSAATFKQELPTMTTRDLAAFMARGITPDEVRRVKSIQGPNITPSDVLKLQGPQLG